MDSIIPLVQNNTLAEYMILSGADNRPPMLDKDLYDSWKSRMELYMKNREHVRMILESVENCPLISPTIEENGVIRTKKYAELSAIEKIQADCDMKATNIILQGLPADIYSLQERECKMYDAFNKFTHIKGETLHKYYLRFTQLINDMNIYNMKIKQFQVNTKFLNSLPPEWSKFVTDVKLVKDLHTTNFDQLHAYLEQHELHANEVRLLRFAVPVFSLEDDPISCLNKAMAFLTAVASSSYSGTGYKGNATSFGGNNASGQARVVKCYNCQGEGQMARQCTQPKRPRNVTWYKEKAMLAEAQEAGQILDEEQLAFLVDPGVLDGQAVQTIIPNNAAFYTEDLDTYDSDCDDISNAQAVLMANISNYGSDVISEVPHSETYLNDMENQSVHAMQDFEQTSAVDFTDNEIHSDSNIIPKSKEKEDKYMENKIDLEKKIKELDNIIFKVGQSAQTMHMLTKPQAFYDNIHKQALGYQNPFYLRKAQRIKPTLYDGIVISDKNVAMPMIDEEVTLILEEKSRSKMSEKGKDPEVIKKNISHKPIDFEKLNRLSKDFGKLEVPSELPKVSLVNASLKKLKFYLAQFNSVVKKRTTHDACTEVSVDKQCLEIAKKESFLENDRLLQQIMSQYVLLIVMNSMSLISEFVIMERKRNESCDKCFNLDAELLKSQNAFNDLLKRYLQLERHFISLESSIQLNQAVFQKYESCDNQNALEILEFFENNDLKAQLQDKDTIICKLKDIIKLMREKSKEENVFKEQFDSIKKIRVCTKEQSDSLIDKLNLKSVKNEDLKAQIQDKIFVITSLKNDLQKVKGKEIVDIAAQIPSANTIVLGMFKLDLEPLAPRLLQNREAHIDYLKYTQEQADILRGIVEQAKAKQPLDKELDFACKHAQRIQELLVYVRDTCPNAINLSAKKVVVTPKNKVKKVRFAEPLTSSSNIKQCSTSNCGSKPTGNKKNDRISRTPSRNMKNKVEAQPRKVNKKNSVVEPIRDVDVKHSLLNANSEPICATCSSKKAKIVKSKNAKHSEPNHAWGSNATDIPSSSSSVMTGCPDCSLLMQDKKPDLSFFHVFGALCYPTNDNDDLGKLDAKADIGIFVGYAPAKKAFRIYNKKTQKFIETIHVTFDELTTMASEQFSSGPGLHFMTPATSSSGLVSNHVSQQPCIPLNRDDWDHLFQPMFDEYFNPPSTAVTPIQDAVAPRAVVLADSSMSTSIDQDALSTSIPSTQEQEHSPSISQGFDESPKTQIFRDDPLNESPHEELTSQGSSSNVRQTHTPFEHLGRWTKDHPIANYHPGKANVVADALSRKSGMIACFDSIILHDLECLDVELCVRGSGGYCASSKGFPEVLANFLESSRWFLISRLLSSLLYAASVYGSMAICGIRLSEDFGKCFTPQQELDAEQAFWFHISNPTIESSNQPPVKVEVSNELPKVSLVNVSLKNLKFYLAQFDSVVKKRTTTACCTKAQLEDKHNTICKLKDIITSMREKSKEESVKYDYGEIETKNGNWRIVFKEQFDSIKKTHVHTKEQSDSLIDKLNLKSVENEDLKAQIQDKVFVITSLKNNLQKVKGKEIINIAAQIPSANTIVLGMFKLDLEPLDPKLLQNRESHIDSLKSTQEQADILWEIVKQAKAKQPLDKELDFACKYAQRIQELLVYVRDTCPTAIHLSAKKVAVIPKNKVKKVRIEVSTSNCRSKPTCNKRNDRISRTTSRNMKNKVEAQPRKVNKKNHVIKTIRDNNVKHLLLNVNSEPICATCKKSMFDGVHDMCILDFVKM
ncbi:retrovirus-related pol polyprotein from transposon TNT 1-94 [Tanacetum coccineum]